ncbi:MarR family winged helix-turn-helix transcriptional regulator [Auraticoccus monumenti]|uniref:DNA-binding transcriptional regulator, MarR family n=1 Tax=Auraticoccus monumenti TaxID=675864 RepID=A0A1G6Z2X6_9ACTN|nr:MarR family transcriptional regulator [Auraticoccus monumenti]SDD96166.1 DNA-binding transcriptional regulator, MarR family [Auraticoccus monumenti]
MGEGRKRSVEELDEVLTWSVVRVARFAGQRLAERLAEHGLNPVHFGVLAYLTISPEMTQADLARAVLVQPQSIAPLLDGLEQRGLVRRTGERARGRRNPVQITDDGRRALDAVWDIAMSTNDLSDAGLTTQESAELNRLLLKIVHATQGTPLDGFYE